MENNKSRLLAKYGLTTADRLSGGMEAEVYAYGRDKVLKLYAGTVSPADIQTLRTFYDALERTAVPYALPAIEQIIAEGDWVITIDPRLDGRPLSDVVAETISAGAALDPIFSRYVDGVLALGKIPMPRTADRFQLYDRGGISQRRSGDWHRFLRRWLNSRRPTLTQSLARDVKAYAQKMETMRALLAEPYRGPHRLVHGDLFPGNMLVDRQGEISAVLDFGLFTMFGDPLFDAATAWVFFDMYDELGLHVRERLLLYFLARLGEELRAKLYRYVLLFSLLGGDAYAPDCSDGHYQWCVDNLNRADYWELAGAEVA